MNDNQIKTKPIVIVKNLVDSKQFKKNYETNLKGLVEKRQGSFKATYLSWAICNRLLHENHPDIFVDCERFNDGSVVHPNEGDGGYLMIYLGRHNDTTNVLERTPSMVFPLMDKSHNSVNTASSRDINDNWMRGAVKAVAIHTGIGLPVFEGEDIPTQDEIDKTIKKNEFFDSVEKVDPIKSEPKKSYPPREPMDEKTLVVLNVPFDQKDMVKSAGARWDQSKKKWCVTQAMVEKEFSLWSAWLSDKDKDKFLDPKGDENFNEETSQTDEISGQLNDDEEGDEDVPF